MHRKLQSVFNFLKGEVARQRPNLFLWSPVCVGLGIILYFQNPDFLPQAFIYGSVIFASFLTCMLWVNYQKTGQNQVILMSITALCFILCGYALGHFRDGGIETILLKKETRTIEIIGVIESITPLQGDRAHRVVLKNVEVNNDVLRIRLKSYHIDRDSYKAGNKVKVKARLIPPAEPSYPGGFDFSRKAYFQGISAVGFTLSDPILLSQDRSNSGHLEQFRAHIGERLYDSMDARHAAIAQALLTGERAGILKDDAENLRISGLAHLLAISGLHIGLVAGCVFFFVRLGLSCVPRLALRYPIKKWAAVCAILIAFGYMLLAGATVPTIRAFIMTSLVLLAVILDRSALNMRLVALAALVVMIVTPESVTGPSFILSFAAVAALIVFYREIGNKLLVNANAYRPVWRPFYYLFGIIVTSIIATLATAPFSVLFFNRFAVWSVLSNIVAMPIMAFLVMPFGLIGTLLIPFEADGIFWTVMEEGIAAILLTAESIAAYPYASLYIPTPSIFETILISIGFIWLLLWQGCLRWGGLFLIILALTLTLTRQTQSIMISDDMKAILVVDKYADNLLLIGKMNGYLKRHWFGFHGYAPDVDIPNYKDGINLNSETIQCDDFLCNVAFYDTKITILINPLGLKKACETADILIASIPASKRQCQSKTIIDRFDVWRHGATMVYVNSNKKPMIKTVH